MASSDLKSAALMDQMNSHFSTDADKALTKKIGLVYQIHIAPKKMGFQEEIYVVDLKKGEVTKGLRMRWKNAIGSKQKTAGCWRSRDRPVFHVASQLTKA